MNYDECNNYFIYRIRGKMFYQKMSQLSFDNSKIEVKQLQNMFNLKLYETAFSRCIILQTEIVLFSRIILV